MRIGSMIAMLAIVLSTAASSWGAHAGNAAHQRPFSVDESRLTELDYLRHHALTRARHARLEHFDLGRPMRFYRGSEPLAPGSFRPAAGEVATAYSCVGDNVTRADSISYQCSGTCGWMVAETTYFPANRCSSGGA